MAAKPVKVLAAMALLPDTEGVAPVDPPATDEAATEAPDERATETGRDSLGVLDGETEGVLLA